MTTDPQYGTDELIEMIEPLFVPGNFLTRLCFPEVMEFETAQVSFDRVQPDRRLAPLVSPYSPGKIMQPKGFQVESLIPAYLKPKNPITAAEVMRRRPGEALTGSLSPGERRDAAMLDYMFKHRRYIEQRIEWMASSILRLGYVVLSSPDYPATTVNFARTASLTKTLLTTDRWGESGVSPYDNVSTWIGEVADTSGAAVNIVIMDGKAWKLYAADPQMQKALDKTLGQTAAITLGLTPALPGSPVFKGRDGSVEFYVYNDTYEADDGSAAKMLPDYSVMLISQGGIEGVQMFGAILDPRNNYGAARYFAKNWIEDEVGAEFVETASAPLPYPRRIDATLFATVR